LERPSNRSAFVQDYRTTATHAESLNLPAFLMVESTLRIELAVPLTFTPGSNRPWVDTDCLRVHSLGKIESTLARYLGDSSRNMFSRPAGPVTRAVFFKIPANPLLSLFLTAPTLLLELSPLRLPSALLLPERLLQTPL
jgi:hypothetical protein